MSSKYPQTRLQYMETSQLQLFSDSVLLKHLASKWGLQKSVFGLRKLGSLALSDPEASSLKNYCIWTYMDKYIWCTNFLLTNCKSWLLVQVMKSPTFHHFSHTHTHTQNMKKQSFLLLRATHQTDQSSKCLQVPLDIPCTFLIFYFYILKKRQFCSKTTHRLDLLIQ
jgi:hypothetical protein